MVRSVVGMRTYPFCCYVITRSSPSWSALDLTVFLASSMICSESNKPAIGGSPRNVAGPQAGGRWGVDSLLAQMFPCSLERYPCSAGENSLIFHAGNFYLSHGRSGRISDRDGQRGHQGRKIPCKFPCIRSGDRFRWTTSTATYRPKQRFLLMVFSIRRACPTTCPTLKPLSGRDDRA